MEESKSRENLTPGTTTSDSVQGQKYDLDQNTTSVNYSMFYQEDPVISKAIILRPLEKSFRSKKTFMIAGSIFLVAAGAVVFLIFGPIASTTIALWLLPLAPMLLQGLILASIALASAALTITSIAFYHIVCEKKTIPNPDELVNEINKDGPKL